MKKILLAVGLMAACLSSSAEKVFEYGFETPSSDLTPQKLEYLNFKQGDTRDTLAAGRTDGEKALMLMNSDAVVGNNWERAIKIRTLGLQENTPYRVSFWMKGSQVYGTSKTATNVRTRLMVGKENCDVAVVATGNAAYDYTSTAQDSMGWKKYSYLFFYTNDAVQEAYLKTQKPDSTFYNDHFLCLNVYNPGKYYLDDILIEKASMRGFTFNGYNIKVDFGYSIDYAALYNGTDYKALQLPKECVSVKYDGEEVGVWSVEVQETGLLIFLESTRYLTAEDADKVSISFTNPTDPKFMLKYNDAKRPFSWDPTSDNHVLSFTDEKGGVFDPNIYSYESLDFKPPFLKSVTPEKNSFELELTSTTYELVYSKPIDPELVSAQLSGAAGKIVLELQETELSDTLHFKVPASKTLTNGSYRLTVSNVTSEYGTPADKNDVIDYEYGPSLAGNPDTLLNANAAWAAAGKEKIPAGWRSQLGTEIVGDTIIKAKTGGIRPFVIPNSKDKDFTAGMYLSSRNSNPAIEAKIAYGHFKGFKLHMKPGKYAISFYLAYWENGDRDANINKSGFRLTDTTTTQPKTILFEQKNLVPRTAIGGAGGAPNYVGGAQLYTFNVMISEEDDYLAEWFFLGSNNSLQANFVGGFKVISIPSEGYAYKLMVATAVEGAQTYLGVVDSFIYNGTAKNNLSNMIAYGQTFHSTTPSAWTKTADDINLAVTAMSTHKTNIDNYYIALNNSKKIVADNAGTIYAPLAAYGTLSNFIVTYDSSVVNVDSDIDVVAAKDSLTKYYNSVKGSIDTHTANISSYYSVLTNSKNVVKNNVGNYYSQSVNYDKLSAFIVTYDSSVVNEDIFADVITAKDSLTYYHSRVQGAINATVPLKARITKAVTLAESLTIRVPAADLQAAKAAYTDDDAIANDLKVKLKAYIEANIAEDSLVFLRDSAGTSIDMLSKNLKTYLDLTGFIKNPNLYTMEKTSKLLTDNSFPGWKTLVTRGAPEVIVNLASDVNPVVNSSVQYYAPGTTAEMWQEVTDLPNGIYTLAMTTRMPTNYNTNQDGNQILDATGAHWTLQTIADSMGIFAINATDTLRSAFFPTGNPGTINNLSTNTYVNDVLVTDGKLTIGVTCHAVPVFTPTIFWGNPILRMTGKDPNTTYVNPVKNVQNAAAVKEVQYFNIQGARLSAPAKGLNIVKTIYSNGASKVEKIMIK